LEPTGLAKPGKTRSFIGTGTGLAHQDAPGLVFGRVWNRTKLFFRFQPGPLVGYPDPLLTLPTRLGDGYNLQNGTAPHVEALENAHDVSPVNATGMGTRSRLPL